MTKIDTPMKRLSNNLSAFKLFTEPYFKNITLNKSQSKYNPTNYETSKGVESDFISIFKSTSTQQSLAFVFTYLDKPSEKHTVEASIRDESGEITSGNSMTIAEFKSKLNELNKALNKKPYVIEQHIWNEFVNIFDIKPINIKKEIVIAQKKYVESITQKEQEINLSAKEKSYLNCKKQLEKAMELKDVTLSQSKEAEIVADLQKKLEIAKITLSQKAKNIEQQLKIPTLIKQVKDNLKDFQLAKAELENFALTEKNKLPKQISKKIKPR